MLPEQLEEWKAKLMNDLDEVRSWMHEHVYDAPPEEVLEPAEVQAALAASGIRMSVPGVPDEDGRHVPGQQEQPRAPRGLHGAAPDDELGPGPRGERMIPMNEA